MKFLLCFLFSVVISLSSLWVSNEEWNTGAASSPRKLTIISTTDFHSALNRAEGLANEIISFQRQSQYPTIHLNGGDFFSGSLEGDLNQGKSVIELFNFLKLDAAAIGNHDLNYGAGKGNVLAPDPRRILKVRVGEAKFAWLSANWTLDSNEISSKFKNALGQFTLFPPHTVLVRGGLRIGIIGATTPFTSIKTPAPLIAGTRFEPLKEVIEAEVKYLRQVEKCDAVLLTVHAGLVCEPGQTDCLQKTPEAEIYHLLRAIKPGSIDAVIAGHTHEKTQECIQGTPVVQSGAHGSVVGILHLNLDTHEHRFDPFIQVKKDAKNSQVSEMLHSYRAQAEILRAQRATELETELPYTPYRETALGNLVADALLAEAGKIEKVDIAVIPGFHLRPPGLPSKTVTYGDLFKLIPFDDYLVVSELTGAQLKQSVEIASNFPNGVASVSGLKVTFEGFGDKPQLYQENPTYRKIIELKSLNDNQLIDEKKIYRVLTLDFISLGGDHQNAVYDFVPKDRLHYLKVYSRDALFHYLQKKRIISPDHYFSALSPRMTHPTALSFRLNKS